MKDEDVHALVPGQDYVRIQGFGATVMFSVHGVGKNPRREWLEVYGPLDKWGHAKPKAKHHSVLFDMVLAKVRNPPKKVPK